MYQLIYVMCLPICIYLANDSSNIFILRFRKYSNIIIKRSAQSSSSIVLVLPNRANDNKYQMNAKYLTPIHTRKVLNLLFNSRQIEKKFCSPADFHLLTCQHRCVCVSVYIRLTHIIHRCMYVRFKWIFFPMRANWKSNDTLNQN